MKRELLILVDVTPGQQKVFEDAGYTMTMALTPDALEAALAQSPERWQAVLTHGTRGMTLAEMKRLPNLKLVCAQGAGYDQIDLDAARQVGALVTHSPGANASSVADHAMALLCATVRGVPQGDRAIRKGIWSEARTLRPTLSGHRLGVMGMGFIGQEIARRGALGFGMEVAYYSRRPRPDVSYLFKDTPEALAEWADFIVVATPGGAQTNKLVNASVLQALGPQGFLVNIARGSVVDTAALVDALRAGKIGGAALDVFDNEPGVPAELLDIENLVMTPHTAGLSPEAVENTVRRVVVNLNAFFDGSVPPNVVAEMAAA